MKHIKLLFMFVLTILSLIICVPAIGLFCLWLAGGENVVCAITLRNALCVIASIVLLYFWIALIYFPLILKYERIQGEDERKWFLENDDKFTESLKDHQ